MTALDSENLQNLVVKGAGQRFAGADFRDLRKPGVYVFLLEGIPLYVGMGKMLLRRIGSAHKQAQTAIEDCDQVLLYPCVNEQAASELETVLIGKLKPLYNVNRGMYVKKLLGIVYTSSLFESTRFKCRPTISRAFRSFQPKLNNSKEMEIEQNIPG